MCDMCAGRCCHRCQSFPGVPRQVFHWADMTQCKRIRAELSSQEQTLNKSLRCRMHLLQCLLVVALHKKCLVSVQNPSRESVVRDEIGVGHVAKWSTRSYHHEPLPSGRRVFLVIRPNPIFHFAPFLSTHFFPRLNTIFKNGSFLSVVALVSVTLLVSNPSSLSGKKDRFWHRLPPPSPRGLRQLNFPNVKNDAGQKKK